MFGHCIIVTLEVRPYPDHRLRLGRVQFPLFEIVSNPTIPLAEIRQRRFNLIERVESLSDVQIQEAEDAMMFAALEEAYTLVEPAPALDRDYTSFGGVGIRDVIEQNAVPLDEPSGT